MPSRIRSLVFGAVFAAGMLATALVHAADQFINVLTGGTSGVYYPLGVALGNTIGKAMPGAKTSVQATKASVENLNLLQPAAARSPSRSAIRYRMPGKATRRPGSRRRSRNCAASPRSTPTTSRSSRAPTAGIKTLADLKGKSVSVGAPKSGTELNARVILAAAGLTYKDFAKVEYLPFGESRRAHEESPDRRHAAVRGPRRLGAA